MCAAVSFRSFPPILVLKFWPWYSISIIDLSWADSHKVFRKIYMLWRPFAYPQFRLRPLIGFGAVLWNNVWNGRRCTTGLCAARGEWLSVVKTYSYLISRKVVGKSERDNPERHCGWFWVLFLARKAMKMCLQVLKESHKSRFDSYSRQEQCIDHIPYYLSGLSRGHFFRQPFLEIAVYWACQYFVTCARLKDSRDVAEIKQVKAEEDAPLSPSPAGFLHNFLLHDCLIILDSGTG